MERALVYRGGIPARLLPALPRLATTAVACFSHYGRSHAIAVCRRGIRAGPASVFSRRAETLAERYQKLSLLVPQGKPQAFQAIEKSGRLAW